jgi:hypothetical protein
MVYVVGVSSGAFGVAEARERPELAGLFKKAQTCITKGVRFVQLDLESVAEFYEPELEKKLKENITEKLGVSYGIHSETKAFGVEAAELDSAIKMEYERAHKRIIEILKWSRKIKAKYVLIHSSESEPFRLLEKTLQSCDLVDPEGNPFRDFLNKNRWLLFWLISGGKEDKIKKMIDIVMNVWKEKGLTGKIEKQDIEEAFKKNNIEPQNFFWLELLHGRTFEEYLADRIMNRVQSEEISVGRKYADTPEIRERVDMGIQRTLEITFTDILDYVISIVQSRDLHYGPEKWAYYFVAKWMEDSKDPLWGKIVNASIKFYAKREGKSVEEWFTDKKIDPKKLSIEDDNFRMYYELWVPAVSARYIFGHFFPTKSEYEDPKKYLDEKEMIFALESPMGGRGIEEWMRLSNPYLYYFLVEEVNRKAGKDIFAIALDFEHMLSSRIDPKIVAELIPEGGGRYIRIIHAGWPSTLAPAHLPIKVGSDAQRYLYELYYKYRQKGFGKDPKIECFILFERGPPETLLDSVVALKLIVEFLEKDVPPEKLPLEFYGIAPKEIFAEERQLATIKEHAYEPLRDLLVLPEEIHGLFGRAAIEKGVPPEKWKKEELR